MIKKLLEEIKNHKVIYILLLATIVVGFYLRVYRIDKVLGFYFDQGRDALVIWDLWHKGELFLVGPTTGIAGIFRGPYYYFLIAPFYLLGGGNPIFPSIFLSITTVAAVVFVYYLGFKALDRTAGLFAAVIASVSFNLVIASRWLSNPTPMLLLSMVLVWAMVKVTEGRRWAWPVIAAVSGLSLFNFGSAGEVFYFLALGIFFIWQWKNRPDRKNLILSIVLFVLSFAPLVLFDLKHQGILRNNISHFLFGEKSFALPTWRFVWDKLDFYYEVFTNKIFNGRYALEKILFYIISGSFFFYLARLLKNKAVKILLLLFVSVCFGLIFFQGNFGNIYDYYLTGYYLIFILLYALPLAMLWRTKLGKLFVLFFFYLFLTNNANVLNYKLNDGCISQNSICLANQLEAVDWVYKDAGDKPFNVDVYVPPVIPYAYDYLFLWRGATVYHKTPATDVINPLYTLYEADPPNPDRLTAWLARQKGIGAVEETASFGGITVERRARIK